MIRTLHTYIARDLIRVGTLALIAFTLVLTVFSIIEPLRRQGLAPQQVLSLFGYTLPVMLTLTLPIAALFATTIVYGRLSQDNEILACRASGISLVALMQPAFVLGSLVTLASLVLSFQVTPHMAARMARAAKASIREIVYHKLRTENSFDYAGFIVHADRVDPKNNVIQGVVVADEKRKHTKGTVALYAASMAKVQFAGEGEDADAQKYVTFEFYDGVPLSPEAIMVPQPKRFKASAPLPRILKEEPSWYDLAKLRQTLRNPVANTEIRQALANVRRLMRYDKVAHELAAAAQAGQPYRRLRRTDSENLEYVIRSVGAKVGAPPGTAVLLSLEEAHRPGDVELAGWGALAGLAQDSLLRVEVLEVRDGRIVQRVVGDGGRVLPTQAGGIVPSGGLLITSAGQQTAATIEVMGQTQRTRFDPGNTHQIRAESWRTGRAEVPPAILAQTDSVALSEIFENPDDLGLSPPLRKTLGLIKTWTLERLRNHIIAELNARSAYCLSCFLMVVLGGALGVLFRGGQVISAFALSVAPAAIVIVLILMGKQMIRNPEVSVQAGLASIWSGLVVLIVANLIAYRKLTRR